jgi:hypothetical protein
MIEQPLSQVFDNKGDTSNLLLQRSNTSRFTCRVKKIILALIAIALFVPVYADEPVFLEAPPGNRFLSFEPEEQPFSAQSVLYQNESLITDPTVPSPEQKPILLPISINLSFVGGERLSITQTQIGMSVPVYAQPGVGSSGPDLMVMASVDFGANFLDGDTQLYLPGELYTAGGGLKAVKRINDDLKFIGGININFKGDGEATSDVLNLSGVGMLQWEKSEQHQWMFGVVVTGIDDIPVLPVVGVTWKPSEDWEVSLGMPQTRVARRVHWFGSHQDTWLYTGFLGAGGGSYAVRRPDGMDDLLTLNEYPLALGIERRSFRAKWFLEAGVVVGRQLEYEHSGEKERLGEGAYLRAGLKY